MAEDPIIKKIPEASSEVAKMLGITGASDTLPMDKPVSHGDLPVAHPAPSDSSHVQSGTSAQSPISPSKHDDIAHTPPPAKIPDSKLVKAVKTFGPYLAVFAVGLFLYYFFFSATNININLSSVLAPAPKASTPAESAISQLETADAASYQAWINGYYYDVTDPTILDPNSDNSGNGLSNFQKYLLDLNPKSYDTLGLGHADSQTLAAGIDPSTDAPLSDAKKAIISKYIDMEVVMNRLTLENLQHPEAVAGLAVNSNGTAIKNPFTTPTQTQATQPEAQTNIKTQSQNVAPVTGADLGDNIVNSSGISINTNVPGLLEIPDLKISAPIIWTKDTNDFDTDLESGVVHYPGTAMPGEIGTTYIAGHSSNYVWAKGNYNHIFTQLGNLAVNTSFQITVTQTNGEKAIFHYIVTRSQQYLPTDQAQFANTGQSIVALSTCWPVNSTAKRLVVFGQLTQVEK